MFLTLSTTHQPTTDLGWLLHKHPDRVQSFCVAGGMAHAFYPEATPSVVGRLIPSCHGRITHS